MSTFEQLIKNNDKFLYKLKIGLLKENIKQIKLENKEIFRRANSLRKSGYFDSKLFNIVKSILKDGNTIIFYKQIENEYFFKFNDNGAIIKTSW